MNVPVAVVAFVAVFCGVLWLRGALESRYQTKKRKKQLLHWADVYEGLSLGREGTPVGQYYAHAGESLREYAEGT